MLSYTTAQIVGETVCIPTFSIECQTSDINDFPQLFENTGNAPKTKLGLVLLIHICLKKGKNLVCLRSKANQFLNFLLFPSSYKRSSLFFDISISVNSMRIISSICYDKIGFVTMKRRFKMTAYDQYKCYPLYYGL